MPCIPFRMGDARGFVCVKGRAAPKRCAYCGSLAQFLCDWPKGKGTCDRPMCSSCALQVDVNLHQCRGHTTPGLF